MMILDSSRMIILTAIAVFLLAVVVTSPALGLPRFEGLVSALPAGLDTVTLKWNPAQKEDQNPAGQITYLIYQATESGAENYGNPNYTTKDTSYRVTGLASNTTYYFVVRAAKDSKGNVDSNRVERSAVTFGRWVEKKTANAPPPRLAHGMTYDPENRQVILFGGRHEKNGEMNDAWIYNIVDNTWAQL